MFFFGHNEGIPVVVTNSDKLEGYWLIEGKWEESPPAVVIRTSALDVNTFARMVNRRIQKRMKQ